MEIDKIIDLSMLYSSLGDDTRLSIAIALIDGAKNVNNICDELKLSQPTVSHHLRILKDRRLVKSVKDGKNVIYSIEDEHVAKIIKMGIEHMEC